MASVAPVSHRFTRRAFLGSLLALAAAACQPASPSQKPGIAQRTDEAFTVILPASDLSVGENRFLVGLIDHANQPISSADVDLRFFKLEGQEATLKSESEARFFGSGLGSRGLYVARTTFDEAGSWGVEVNATSNGAPLGASRVSFGVSSESRTPAIGQPVPSTQLPTASDPDEIAKICSARPVDEFHDLTVEDAVAAGKPFLVLFASPGYCQTQTCGPSLDVVKQLHASHGDRLNVLHVEVFKDPHQGAPGLEVVEAVTQWNLPSEPWLFMIDADGRVFDKFEGGITFEETAPVVQALVGA